MRHVYITRLRLWYMYFTAAFFICASIYTGILPPLSVFNSSPNSVYQPIYQGNVNKPAVAFACNVFWGEEFLPGMLEAFNNEDIKITFFIGGSWAKRYPDMLLLLSDNGHEIANHSYSHPHPNRLSKQKNQEEIQKTEKLIEQIIGKKTYLYAPPYGEFNESVLIAAGELGYKTILWTIDTIDWQRPSSEIITQRVLKKLKNGAIILMHPTESTAKALPGLIREIKSRGYFISTVSQIIQ